MLSLLMLAQGAPMIVAIPSGSRIDAVESLVTKAIEARASRKPNARVMVEIPADGLEFDRSLLIKADNITVRGKPGTTLSGGLQLKGWKPVTDADVLSRLPAASRSEVRVAKVPKGFLQDFKVRGFAMPDSVAHTELFADGTPLWPARYPNVDGPNRGWLLTGAKANNSGFDFDPSRTSKWKQDGHIWAYGYWQFDWADEHTPISTLKDGWVGFGELPKIGAIHEFGVAAKRRFFFSHVLEELDQPGEYWIDFDHDALYAWLPKGAKSMRASRSSEPLIQIVGAKNVTVENLTLSDTRGSGVAMRDAENCVLSGVTIQNTGQTGLAIMNSKNSGLRDGVVRNCGGGGVYINCGDRKTLTRGDCFVENTVFEKIARWTRTYNGAVNIEGVGNRVVGNRIENLPHLAVHFGGNDHLIERNDVSRVCQETGDSGAFYTGRDLTTRGTVIKWNRFREIRTNTTTEGTYPEVICVYLDDCQAGIEIIGNVFEAECIGIMIGGGSDNVVEGNVFLNNDRGINYDARARGWAKANFASTWGIQARVKAVPTQESPWKERYPRLYRQVRDGVDLSYPQGNRIAGNVCFGKEWIRWTDGTSEKDCDYRDNLHEKKEGTLAEALKLVPSRYGKIPLDKIGPRTK